MISLSRLFRFFLACVVVSVAIVSPQNSLAQNMETRVYGYFNLAVEAKDSYFNWARFGLKGEVFDPTCQISFEYDAASNNLIFAQAVVERSFWRGKLSFAFGKLYLPTQYPTPSPISQKLSRFPLAVNFFTTSMEAVSIWYQKYGITMRYARCDTLNNVALDWKGFAIFHEDNVGSGVIWDSQWPTRWINPMIGSTRYQKLGDMAFVQNHVKLWNRGVEELRFYGQIDWQEDQSPIYLAGVHYAWRTIWLQMFYDSTNNKINVSLATQF